ncbi:hypothetical protein BU16DRAFT_555163 [Lophium mytilinum]|uniref:BTB domain-containing protein n=1 Tax=Lophium mytilinum TaxID=390894 RepID=A0A6A6RF99_9PEZI|nr:hypothetical protein BU16DRAFT_555163 [Lophium mytilinum]
MDRQAPAEDAATNCEYLSSTTNDRPPYLYQTVITLQAGPYMTFPVHKELLASKSPVIAEHLKLALLHSKIEATLKEKLRDVKSMPKAVNASPGGWSCQDGHPNCGVICNLAENVFGQAADEIKGTLADLGSLKEQVFSDLANRNWDWKPPKGKNILWDLEANNELATLNYVVDGVAAAIEKRLLKHITGDGQPESAAYAAMDRFELPEGTARPEVEILIHALYTGRLQTMDAHGVFHESTPRDLVRVFSLAKKLQIKGVQRDIVDFFQKKNPELMKHIWWKDDADA